MFLSRRGQQSSPHPIKQMADFKNIVSYLTSNRLYNLLIIPILILILVFFLWPIFRLLLGSLFTPSFTIKHYANMFVSPQYLVILLTTFKIAFFTTIICFVLGYPLAYLLSSVSGKTAGLLLILVLFPFWTSILVRTYAWMIILGRNGILNNLLIKLGILSSPLDLMYNLCGVLVGMVQIMLPFMILPLFSVMKGIDRDLMRASQSLGAHPYNTFWKIFFPLSMPGIKASCLLVFIVSLGFFVTPALLGGRKTKMISMIIEDQFTWALDWGFSSALTTVLLFLTIIFLIIYNRFVGVRRLIS